MALTCALHAPCLQTHHYVSGGYTSHLLATCCDHEAIHEASCFTAGRALSSSSPLTLPAACLLTDHEHEQHPSVIAARRVCSMHSVCAACKACGAHPPPSLPMSNARPAGQPERHQPLCGQVRDPGWRPAVPVWQGGAGGLPGGVGRQGHRWGGLAWDASEWGVPACSDAAVLVLAGSLGRCRAGPAAAGCSCF